MNNRGFNCSTLYYYSLPTEYAPAVHYVVEMKDPVDAQALRHALDTTMKRYPYLAKRIVADKEGFRLVDNELPVVIKNTHHSIAICGAEANYHQFALSYADCTIFMSNSHAIFDGRGRSAFMHTLMYYYCQERYGEQVEMEDVNLVGTPIDTAEYYDPFDFPIPEPEVELAPSPAPVKAMKLHEMGLVHPGHTQIHHISIDEKQLMAKCKSSDATPNSAIAVLIGRAIYKLHPDCADPIVATIGCDPRAALNAPKTHHDLATSLLLTYDPKMAGLDFSVQNTIFRSEIILKSDPSMLRAGAKALQQLCNQVNAMPTLEEKVAFCRNFMPLSTSLLTYAVSYSGKSDFGSCSKHIAAIFPELSFKGVGFGVEIAATDGKFFLTITQDWKEDVYFNAFLKELAAEGIDYDLLYSAQLDVIKVEQCPQS